MGLAVAAAVLLSQILAALASTPAASPELCGEAAQQLLACSAAQGWREGCCQAFAALEGERCLCDDAVARVVRDTLSPQAREALLRCGTSPLEQLQRLERLGQGCGQPADAPEAEDTEEEDLALLLDLPLTSFQPGRGADLALELDALEEGRSSGASLPSEVTVGDTLVDISVAVDPEDDGGRLLAWGLEWLGALLPLAEEGEGDGEDRMDANEDAARVVPALLAGLLGAAGRAGPGLEAGWLEGLEVDIEVDLTRSREAELLGSAALARALPGRLAGPVRPLAEHGQQQPPPPCTAGPTLCRLLTAVQPVLGGLLAAETLVLCLLGGMLLGYYAACCLARRTEGPGAGAPEDQLAELRQPLVEDASHYAAQCAALQQDPQQPIVSPLWSHVAPAQRS